MSTQDDNWMAHRAYILDAGSREVFGQRVREVLAFMKRQQPDEEVTELNRDPQPGDRVKTPGRVGVWTVRDFDPATGGGHASTWSEVDISFWRSERGGFVTHRHDPVEFFGDKPQEAQP